MYKLLKIEHTKRNLIKNLCKYLILFAKEYYGTILTKNEINKILYFDNEKVIKNEIKDNLYKYYLILKNDKTIGFIQLKQQDDSIYLSKIYLSKDYRKKGISYKIIDEIKNIADKLNFNNILFAASENNKNLKLISEKWGFIFLKKAARYLGDDIYIYEDLYILRIHVE